MFGKKTYISPVAMIESEPTVTQPESTPVPAPATVRVSVLKPLQEAGHDYAPEEEFETTAPRAQHLAELGLVAVIDPDAPREVRPKLQVARRALAEAEQEFTARSREQAQVEQEVQRAGGRVDALRLALNAAEGLEDVRAAQDALAEARGDLEAKRQFLENVARRARESDTRVQAARKVFRDLEARAAWLRTEGIPGQEQDIIQHRRNHEELLKQANAYLEGRVRPAEAQLQTLQAELAALGEQP